MWWIGWLAFLSLITSEPTSRPTNAPTPSPISGGTVWREVFPQRQIQQTNYGDNLPSNVCAPDMFPKSSWAFRRRSSGIDNVPSITDVTDLLTKPARISDGDWLRFTGQFVLTCSGIKLVNDPTLTCPDILPYFPIITPSISSSSNCHHMLSFGTFSSRSSVNGSALASFDYAYYASFVLEYRYSNNTSYRCGALTYLANTSSSTTMSLLAKPFQFQDSGLNAIIPNFFQQALFPLLAKWTVVGGVTFDTLYSLSASSSSPSPSLTVHDFCALRFIQCLSLPIDSYPFDQFTYMYPFFPPSMYFPIKDKITIDASVYDSSMLTGYALLLGGDNFFSPTNTYPLNWNVSDIISNNYTAAINAMFLLDLSFNPNLFLALNAPLNLRVLLLSGSPGIELQYDSTEMRKDAISGQEMYGQMIGNKNNTETESCNRNYCTRSNQAQFDFSASINGIHPKYLKVLSLSIERDNYYGFYLRDFPSLALLQVDDSNFQYPGAYESIYYNLPSSLASAFSLPSQVSDNWPKSILPKYDISCRDMYFDRYFLYGDNYVNNNIINIPGSSSSSSYNRDSIDPLTNATSQASVTNLTSAFLFECWLNQETTSLRYVSVFGLPIEQFTANSSANENNNNNNPVCFNALLEMLQIEGSLLRNTDADLFGDAKVNAEDIFFNNDSSSNSSVNGFSPTKTVRLAHNIRLTNIDNLLQVPMKNLLIYGNKHLNFSSLSFEPAQIDYVDVSFSDILSSGWEEIGDIWKNVSKLTCRMCGAYSFPLQKQVPSLSELRLPSNLDFKFDLSDVSNDMKTKSLQTFLIDFSSSSSQLVFLDLSFCKIFGSFPNIYNSSKSNNNNNSFYFPKRVSFAYNQLQSFSSSSFSSNNSNFVYNDSLLFPPGFNNSLIKTKFDLRGNLFVGPEPDWFSSLSLINSNNYVLDMSNNEVSCHITQQQRTQSSTCVENKTALCTRQVCGGGVSSSVSSDDMDTISSSSSSSGNNYCSWNVLNTLPRTLSSVENSVYNIKFSNFSLLNIYQSFAASAVCNSNNLFIPYSSPGCTVDFCAFLRFYDNTYAIALLNSSSIKNTKSNNYIDINFAVSITQGTMNSKCIPQQQQTFYQQQQQMPVITNSILISCEANVDLLFGNQTHIQKYMPLPSLLLITQCGEGKYFDEGNCKPCPFDNYMLKPDISVFDITAQCTPCPGQAKTKILGATSQNNCYCPDGTWGFAPLCNSSSSSGSNNNNHSSSSSVCCLPCPGFATCFETNNTVPVPFDGYILDANDKSKVLECIPHVACKNGGCVDGYFGNACSQCRPHYYRLQQECIKCPNADGFMIFLAIFIFFIGSLFLLKGSKPSINKIYTISITVGFVQIISIFASFPVKWPTQATVMFDIFSFVNFNIDLFSPECALDLTFYEKWGLKMLMPVMLFLFFVLIFAVVKFVPFLRRVYVKFLLWSIGADVKRVVPAKYRNIELQELINLQRFRAKKDEDFDNFETNDNNNKKGEGEEAGRGSEQVVVRSLNALPLSASKSRRFTEAEIQVSIGFEKVVPLSAAAQYETDREWEDAHLSTRFVHAFVASCCIGYTFLAKTSTQVFNCVNTGGDYFIRYDPSVTCYDTQWYNMEIVAVFAIVVYTFGIPLFFFAVLVKGWREGIIETPAFYLHFGQLVLPYRAQYWYWELIQIGRKLIIVMIIDFGANAEGDNTYTQISGVLVMLLLFLVLQEFIKPYEFTWCNRLAFTWTAISLLVLVCALFFVVGSLTDDQRSDYGIGLLVSCFLGLLISLYTALRENQRASAKTRVAPTKDFLATGQEEQAVVNTIFGRTIGEPLYRKTRGLHPTARAGFYHRLVRMHTTVSDGDFNTPHLGLKPEEEIAQVRARLSELESHKNDPKKSLLVELPSHPSHQMCPPSSSPRLSSAASSSPRLSSAASSGSPPVVPMSVTPPSSTPLVSSSQPPPPYSASCVLP